jgi:hypothetical protein
MLFVSVFTMTLQHFMMTYHCIVDPAIFTNYIIDQLIEHVDAFCICVIDSVSYFPNFIVVATRD